jgi:hypothetical protein
MAKRIVKWSLDNTILKLSKALEDPKATAEIMAEFDLAKLFPTFTEMTIVQRQVVVYGVKQKLMDVGAGEIAEVEGKVQRAKTKFQELLDGKWEGERVNATGAADNKRIVSEVKEAAKAVTLQGLMMKKIAFPGTFTTEDEAKLQEFLAVYASNEAKGKGRGK